MVRTKLVRAIPRCVPRSSVAMLAVVVPIVALVQGCGLPAAGTKTTAPGSAAVVATSPASNIDAMRPVRSWIVPISTLQNLLQHDTSGIVRQTFDTPTTYVIIGPNQGVPAGWTSVPTQDFKSFYDMNIALDGGTAPDGTARIPGIRAVLYDDEKWSATPSDEQSQPLAYVQKAATLVHGKSLKFVSTPALDLFGSVSAYLNSGVAKTAGRFADVYDIQAQSQQGDLDSYTHMVNEAAAQAKNAGGSVVVLAGVTTNHNGTTYTAAQIDSAMHSVTPTPASGFWINDPAAGTSCPACTGPNPNIAVRALQNY